MVQDIAESSRKLRVDAKSWIFYFPSNSRFHREAKMLERDHLVSFGPEK